MRQILKIIQAQSTFVDQKNLGFGFIFFNKSPGDTSDTNKLRDKFIT